MAPDDADLADIDPAFRDRVRSTISIRATDAIEKVADAGTIQERDGQAVQVMHNGVVVVRDCYGGPWMTEVIRRLRGHHEPQEEVVFHAILERLARDTEAPMMIELGAFWAYYSLWFSHRIPGGRVVLVEPDPVNLEVGRRNFTLNRMTPAASVQAAVGLPHGASIEIPYESDGVFHPVRAVSLPGLMAEQGLDHVDLVLCDVQGAEVAMLDGAADAVRSGQVRFMVISTHWSDTDPLIHQTCRERVVRLGGHVIAEHTLPESCSGDGLIAVSFDDRDRDLEVHVPLARARDSLVGELEWVIARRSGWRGILWGAVDLVPPQTRARLGATPIGTALHRRLIARRGPA